MSHLPRQLEALARTLTYMLGHRPDEFGLVLSEAGSASIKQVLQALAAEPGWGFVRRRHLEEVTALLDPPRFEITGEHIMVVTPAPPQLRRPRGEMPPALLYLAISPKARAGVWENGLKTLPGGELLLAATPEFALKLGRRRSPEPVLVTVQARAAARAGVIFQGYGEELFLVGALPREFLQMSAPPMGRERPKPEGPAKPRPEAGSLVLDLLQVLQGPLKTRGKKGEPAWKSGARALRRRRRGREE